MFAKRYLILLFVTAAMALTVIGQTPSSTPSESKTAELNKKEETQANLNAQAYELLDAIVKDVQRMRLPQNRAYFFVIAGEMFWSHDEQTARAIFKEAAVDLLTILRESSMSDVVQARRQSAERAQFRELVLFGIARHDSQMALDLLAQTHLIISTVEDSDANSELELETRLAAVIAENDPTHALEIARKSLAKGFNNTLPKLLSEIQKKDQEAAAELANDILVKLKSANFLTDQDAANVAVKLFEMATVETKPKEKSATTVVTQLLTEQSLRDLAELIAAAAISVPPEGGRRYLNIGDVQAQLIKYAPSRAQQLRRLSTLTISESAPEAQSYLNYQKLVETGTAQDLIEAAEKDVGMSESYYGEAALKLVNDDKIEQARQVINEHISDPNRRQQMLSVIDRQALTAAVEKGDIEKTRRLMSSTGTDEERIRLLTQLATSLAGKGDKKAATKLLEEARNLSSGRTRYARQLVARLQIVQAYALVDPAQSLAILEPMIDQLNELIAAGIVLAEFFGEEEVMRDDEVLILNIGPVLAMLNPQFVKQLALIANADFARTRDLAERFQRPEARLMARLMVAGSILMPDDDKSKDLINGRDDVQPDEELRY